MNENYKTDLPEEEKSIELIKNESKDTTDCEEEEIYEKIFNEFPMYSSYLLSDDESSQITALKWIRSTFYHIAYVFPPNLLIALVNMLSSQNPEIVDNASGAITWAISFPSVNIEVLLSNGLFTYILSFFPQENAVTFCYHLTAHSVEARDLLIQNGYLDKIPVLGSPETTHVYASQLTALVNLPYKEIDPETAAHIFSLFQTLLLLFTVDEDHQFAFKIVSAFCALVKSNEQFLYAFMSMDMFHVFLEAQIDNEGYLVRLFQMLQFICNQNEKFNYILISHKVIEFADVNIIDEFPDASIEAVKFLTDLMFYCPDIIETVYNMDIPLKVADMFFDDDANNGEYIVETLSFAVVMMALSSPMIYSRLKSKGYYELVARNAASVEDNYVKWTLRVLGRGFVTGKDFENNELRKKLYGNQELVGWLEALRGVDNVNISESAAYLLNRIFPDAQIPVVY